MNVIEIVCSCICGFFCVFHLIVQFVIARKTGKKIDGVCDKCFSLKYEDEEHICSLTEVQLQKLVDFVSSLKGNDYGCSN